MKNKIGNKTKKFVAVLLAMLMLFGITACGENKGQAQTADTASLEKYAETFYDAFDTQITIIAYCKSQEEFDALFKVATKDFLYYHELFDIYHTYEGINNMCTVNSKAAVEAVKVDPEIINLIKLGVDLNKETSGKVNIAMGSVLRLWHDARTDAENFLEEPYIPEMSELKAANEHVNIDDIIINEKDSTISFKDPYLKLDVGAIAKGYATERIAEKLEGMGLNYIAINAGGNVRTIGPKPTGSWVIGIQNPDKSAESAYVKKVQIDGMSVVTSGVYERNFEVDGKVYHHIIDPDTLMPEDNYQSVSILIKDSGLADAYSTALFNMSLEEGKAYAKKHKLNVMWILNDFSIVTNDGFAALIKD